MKIDESSLTDLYLSAVRAFPNTTKRQHATQPVEIESIRWTPFVGMKTLFVKGWARNEDRHYNPIILFKGIDYGQNDLQFVASDGKEYSMARLSTEHNDVLVRCNCNDHFWRFRHYNYLDRSLYGPNRKPYESKGIGPPANPLQLPGLCKHLMKMSYVLGESGIFQ